MSPEPRPLPVIRLECEGGAPRAVLSGDWTLRLLQPDLDAFGRQLEQATADGAWDL